MDQKPVELTTAVVLPEPGNNVNTGGLERQVAVEPTQMRRPWQATIRTAFQALVALATLVPLVLTDVYDSPDAYPAVIAQVVFVAGLVSRIMANPAVEEFLRMFLPFLAAAPTPTPGDENGHVSLMAVGVALLVASMLVWLLTTADVFALIVCIVGLIVIVMGAARAGSGRF